MKRFDIHWSMRWGIRLIYGIIILGLIGYLGLGLFIRSKLAGDLLVRKLTAQAGRPVKIGQVSLDWFHGFHVVLKDVVVPSLNGGSPPISCKSMNTTVEIWPFISRREIIFRHIRLEDGVLRLRRDKQGKWRGVFPVPVRPVSKTPKIVKPKKAKRRFVLFFPKVTLKKIFIEVTLESNRGKKTYKMFLKSAETIGSSKTEKFTAKADGTFMLDKSHRPVAFRVRGSYTLLPPFPFDAEIHLSGFSLDEITRFYGEKPRWKLEGLSEVSLWGQGTWGEKFRFHGKVSVQNPRFLSPRCLITTPSEQSTFTLDGNGSGVIRGTPILAVEVKSTEQDVKVRLLQDGQVHYAQRGVFRNLVIRGKVATQLKKAEASLTCDYRFGKTDETVRLGRLHLQGSWSALETPEFSVKVLATRLPLETIVKGIRKRNRNATALRAKPSPAIGYPPLRFLDRFEGKVSGKMKSGNQLVVQSQLDAVWGKSVLALTVAPFEVSGNGPVEVGVTGDHLDPSIIRSTPYLLNLLPPKAQKWVQSFQGGEIQALKGQVRLVRGSKGKKWKGQVKSVELKMADLSLSLPFGGLQVDGMSGSLLYHVPAVRLSRFRARINDSLDLEVKQAAVPDVFRKPIALQLEGEVSSQGTTLPQGPLSPERPVSLRIPLPKGCSFIPTFFSGAVAVRFKGTLFPFSYQDYSLVAKDMLLKGQFSKRGGAIELPVDVTAHATVTPGSIQVVHASLSCPMGKFIAEGTANRAPSGNWQISSRGNGQLFFDAPSLYALTLGSKKFRVTGKASFSGKAQGIWPKITVQGELNGKKLFCSYKDIFIKNTGVPVSIDFQITQKGLNSCEVDWIRANLRGFIIKVWGNLTSLKPLRGKISCETDTRQLQAFMPLFPRFCQGKQCLLAKGDIQCTGGAVLGEKPTYHLHTILANVSLPFPGGTEPITVAKANILINEHERSIDIRDAFYRDSYVSNVNLVGKLQEGQWFWNAKLTVGFLNLDDFISKLHGHSKRKTEMGAKKEKDRDLVARCLQFIHGKYFQGRISVQEMKILNVHLLEFFTRFHQRGIEGAIKGLNFLTNQKGYGAIDVTWRESGKGSAIDLTLSPLVSNLDFGQILDGILHRSSPFRGFLTFNGTLRTRGGTYQTLRDNLKGNLTVTFKKGVITHWAVLTSIFKLLDIYDIVTLKNLPGISKEGLQYDMIHGTIQVKKGIARTDDAYLKSQPFYMSGEGTLRLSDNHVALLIGVYPFKMLDSFVSHIPILGRIFTNKDKKFIGYFFKAEGDVSHPKVTTVNAKRLGGRLWNTFKKIITLPLYPFQDHSKQKENKK